MTSNDVFSTSFRPSWYQIYLWIIRLVLSFSLAGFFLWMGVEFTTPDAQWMLWVMLLYSLFCIALGIYVIDCIPIRLRVEGNEIMLTKMVFPLRIPLDKVEDVGYMSFSSVRSGINFWHSPRDEYRGRYKHKSLGKVYCYIIDSYPNQLMYIRTKGGRYYVFGCTRIDELIDYLRLRISQSAQS